MQEARCMDATSSKTPQPRGQSGLSHRPVKLPVFDQVANLNSVFTSQVLFISKEVNIGRPCIFSRAVMYFHGDSILSRTCEWSSLGESSYSSD
mmetsp:Transcript_13087/g.40309  ORF Transcript_13087/g.40309 Transcript_13087/m.40309 type:complete len:93 (+) Transcript_13087:1350-1628(+)